MTSPEPESVVRMKAMETGAAPMITVPTGVIKEFITSSPSPPTSSLVCSDSMTDSPKVPAQTRTPSPDLPNALSDSALPTDTSNHMNGVVDNSSDNASTNVNSDNCNSVTAVTSDSTAESTKAQNDAHLVNSEYPEKRVNGTVSPPSLKRPSEEPEGSYPDLKKVRVFSEEKNRSVESSVQEFNKHLDQESKKLGESEPDEIMCISSGNNVVSAVKPDDKSLVDGSESAKHFLSSEPVSTKVDDVLPKFEDKCNSNVVKEDLSLFHSDLEVLTPSRESDILKPDKSKIGGKLRKLSRKELEKIIIRLFSEKTLYQCELGRQKQLCEKLETTLEANRKKTAQFHKEIEDLKKVTNRLSAEQASRKGQFVAPIRIKRSVGIQAAPHIINKGLQHAQNSTIKTIAPRGGSVKSPVVAGGQARVPSGSSPNVTFQTKMIPSHSPNKVPPGGPVVGGKLSTSQQAARPQAVGIGGGGAPSGTALANSSVPVGTVAQATGTIGTVRPAAGQMLMMTQSTPSVMQAIPRPATAGLAVTTNKVLMQGKVVCTSVVPIANIIPSTNVNSTQTHLLIQNKEVTATTNALRTPLVSRGGGSVVDLTADEGRTTLGRTSAAVMPAPGTLVKVPVTGGTQLLAIPQTAGVVLLPNASAGTALVSGVQTVSNVGGNPVMAQARMGPASTSPRVMGTSFRPISTTTTTSSSQNRHPAPLPRTPVQQVAGITKKLPPQPTLKLSHKDNSIVLSWTMSKTEDHETIASYQLYAYQEGNSPPSAALWKKVGSVKALELPMACTLTQFMPGHVYHFAVRAVDIKSRLGPFSDPRSIRLEKK